MPSTSFLSTAYYFEIFAINIFIIFCIRHIAFLQIALIQIINKYILFPIVI